MVEAPSPKGKVSADDSTKTKRRRIAVGAREHLDALIDTGHDESIRSSSPRPGPFRSRHRERGRRRRRSRETRNGASADPVRGRARSHRSYDGPSGANSSGRRPTTRRLLWRVALADEFERTPHSRPRSRKPETRCPACSRPSPSRGGASTLLDRRRGRNPRLARRSRGRHGVSSRAAVRAAVSIAALCEVAVDTAGGGDLDGLIAASPTCARARLQGIEDAEEAARALRCHRRATAARVAGTARRDRPATRARAGARPRGPSPFSAALRAGQGCVSEFQREIEAGYRRPHVTWSPMEAAEASSRSAVVTPRISSVHCASSPRSRPTPCRRRSVSSLRR